MRANNAEIRAEQVDVAMADLERRLELAREI